MDDLYSRNLRVLAGCSPDLADRLRKASPPAAGYRVVSADNGAPSLVLNDARGGVPLHSMRNPVREAAAVVKSEPGSPVPRMVIICGPGLGYLLSEAERMYPVDVQLVVIEESLEIFRLYLSHRDIAGSCRRGVVFLAGLSAAGVIERLREYFWDISTGLFRVISSSPMLKNLSPAAREYYQNLTRLFRDKVKEFSINLNTRIVGDFNTYRNTVLNLKHIKASPGVQALFGKGSGLTAVIVGAGPSLDAVLPYLAQCKGKAVIICVDTALKALLAAGITPDLAVTLDFTDLNYPKVKGIPRDGYRMVSVPCVVPQIMEQFAGSQFIAYIPTPFYTWLSDYTGDKGMLDSGGSVAHLAFDLAVKMGCSQIILTGLDLAFSGGRSHAAGSIYDGVSYEPGDLRKMIPLTGNREGTVYTSPSLWLILNNFERIVAASPVPVINATDGGAVIRGCKNQSLSDIVPGLSAESADIKRIIESAFTSGPDKNRLADLNRNIADSLNLFEERGLGGVNGCKSVREELSGEGRKDSIERGLILIREHYDAIAECKTHLFLIDAYLLRYARALDRKRDGLDSLDNQVGRMHDMFVGIVSAARKYRTLFSGVGR